MSQQLREWAKQALEMLNDNHHLVADNEKHRYVMMHLDVIKRGKALLEQPSPVQNVNDLGCSGPLCGLPEHGGNHHPLCKQAPAQLGVPLTEKEIRKEIPPHGAWKYEVGHSEAIKFARAIEAKLREKNGGAA
jgi:hypothetical protein